MRILFLSAWFPSPPDNGSKIRVYNLLKSLGSRHEVTLLSFARPGDATSTRELDGICQAQEPVPWQRFAPTSWKAFFGYFSPVPRSLVDTYSPAMAARVHAAFSPGVFDAVIASTIEMARYSLMTPCRTRILEEHNFTTRLMQEQYQMQKRRLPRARAWLTWTKYLRYEAQLYARFDAVTMVSEVDAQSVREWLPRAPRVAMIPNGLDLRQYRWDDIIPVPYSTVFTGSLTYSANLDAVRYFLSEVWHRVRLQLPEARLKITGRYDGVPVEEIAHTEGVELTGHIDDIQEAIRKSAVCVVPLRVGSGTRLKILEAMALGTPVVSTSKGAEGLEVTHGENILIADNPAEFAALTCQVLEDPDLRARLRTKARRLIESKYDWNAIASKFEKLLEETVSWRTT